MTGELTRGAGPRGLSEIANSGQGEGGSFAYDEATLRSLVSKWLELADHYRGSLDRINLGSVEGPGLDFASEALAKSANKSGAAYTMYITKNYWYCVKQAQLMQDTLDDYLGVEHHSVIDFTRTGAESTGPQPGI
jgi:hypothetical protein